MKKTILSLSLVALIATGFTACNNEKASDKVNSENVQDAAARDEQLASLPVVEWDKVEHDFGTLKQGDIAETIFTLTNVGKSDLIIAKAKGSCGCTVPEWPRHAIRPGETAEIEVKFNSRNKKGKATNTVTLATNTEKGSEVVRIKAFVEVPENK